jgi:hypothetical protein
MSVAMTGAEWGGLLLIIFGFIIALLGAAFIFAVAGILRVLHATGRSLGEARGAPTAGVGIPEVLKAIIDAIIKVVEKMQRKFLPGALMLLVGLAMTGFGTAILVGSDDDGGTTTTVTTTR